MHVEMAEEERCGQVGYKGEGVDGCLVDCGVGGEEMGDGLRG